MSKLFCQFFDITLSMFSILSLGLANGNIVQDPFSEYKNQTLIKNYNENVDRPINEMSSELQTRTKCKSNY